MLSVGFPPPGCKWKMAGRKLESSFEPKVDIKTVLLSLLPQLVFASSVHFFILCGKQSLYKNYDVKSCSIKHKLADQKTT